MFSDAVLRYALLCSCTLHPLLSAVAVAGRGSEKNSYLCDDNHEYTRARYAVLYCSIFTIKIVLLQLAMFSYGMHC